MNKAEAFVWPLFLLAAILIYLIGVDGPFLFDDFANLNALGSHGGVNDWQSFWIYLSDGHSGPTGRPLSLVSFLIDDNNWPSSPASFKYTNVLIHALNACLLFLLQLKLLRLSGNFTEKQRFWAAIVASSAWLFHPMFVSTTLYVVQRMAMLTTTFVLLGLLFYLRSRVRIESKPKAAYAGMSISLLFFGSLAVLSKENGMLLPVLVLTVEMTVFGRIKSVKKTWSILFLWLPTAVIFTYLIYSALSAGFLSNWPGRSFSPAERLLTEARIIWEYLFHLYMFEGKGGGLFFENYPLSEHLFRPFSNFTAVVLLLCLLIAAVMWRKRFTMLSLSILFFLAGHLIESTTVGLELYFEHRNYLPAVFIFLPLGLLLCNVAYLLQILITLVFVVTVAMLLFFKVEVWSDKISLAAHWVQEAPNSIRAQRSAAIALTEDGQINEALNILEKAQKRFPESHSLLIHRMILKCSISEDIKQEKMKLVGISEYIEFEPKLSNLLDAFVSVAQSGQCVELNSNYALKVVDALMKNPRALNSDGFRHQLHYFLGVLRSGRNEKSQAVEQFSIALHLRPRLGTALRIVSVLATDGNCKGALEFINRGRQILNDNGFDLGAREREYYAREIDILEGKITKSCKVLLD